MFDNLGQALPLPVDLEHNSSYKDDDLILKLKWHNIAVSFYLFEPLLFCWFGLFYYLCIYLCL